MAQLSFRQGIVRTHSTALQFTSGNTVILVNASTAPVSYTFADGESDYFFEEGGTTDPAWTNLPTASEFWLYYEIDALTGERKFGTTIFQPIEDPSPPTSPAIDQHWFDTRPSQEIMNVWNGNRWVPKIRVFAGRVNGTVIFQFPTGTQAGLNTKVRSGFLLFDDQNKTRPLKRFDRRGRGKFITTETNIFSQFSNLTGFRPEQSIVDGQAQEPISQYQCVALLGERVLGLAKTSAPTFPCIGIALEEFATGEVRSFVSTGYLTDDNFTTLLPLVDFNLSPGTPVFVSDTGELTSDVPQSFSLQQIGVIVDSMTLFIDIQPLIIYG